MNPSPEPLISVITVTYNSAAFIDAAVRSILAQTYGSFELLIIDDRSTDQTWEKVSAYKDQRVRAVRNEVNLGEYGNRNKGLELAKGEYVIYIDGDDVLYPHALETYCWYLKRFPDCAMYISRNWDARILCPCRLSPLDVYRFEFLDSGILGGNFTNVLFNAGVLREYGLPAGIATGDSYIQLQISARHDTLIVPGGLAWWRRRSGNATERFYGDLRHLIEVGRYRLDFIGKFAHFSPEERCIARNNLTGTMVRNLLRHFLKGRFAESVEVWRALGLGWSDVFTAFRRTKFDHYRNISGDAPLTERIDPLEKA